MSAGPPAFYLPVAEGRFRSTELTRGPWDPDAQHAGPPIALLARTVERAAGGGDRRVARLTTEILRPVPIATLHVAAEVVRPGRRVDLVEATLRHGEEVLCRARAWRLRTADGRAPEIADRGPHLAGPDEATVRPFFDTGSAIGYHTAMECRFEHGSFRAPGPAAAWMRMRVPLVEGEEPSPLVRAAVVADSGNGISAELDPASHLFVNTDLTITLLRYPRGEWVGIDAVTTIEPDGVGLAESRLHDQDGPIGRGHQTLLVAPAASG